MESESSGMIALLLFLFAQSDGPRTFHPVALKDIPTTKWTHVETCGTVALVKHEADGDWHIRLEDAAKHFIVAEIIPELPLKQPVKGQQIHVRGISREDRDHGWFEVHPVLSWTAAACQ